VEKIRKEKFPGEIRYAHKTLFRKPEKKRHCGRYWTICIDKDAVMNCTYRIPIPLAFH